MRRTLTVVFALVTALAAVGVPSPAGAHPDTTGFHWQDLTARDGVVLKSNVIAPTAAGRHPGIVFVASWGLNDVQYVAQAQRLAAHGYIVLSYTTRGFWFSGGKIEVGGPDDVADAATAVDWLIANTAVDPHRIGIVGLSYGAGISLLAAAQDNRIRAVASLSGWADLAESMTGGNTRRPQAAFFLQAVANVVGRPSDEMNRVLADYWADRNADYRKAWADQRSAAYSVDAINRNHPAVLITQAYGDSFFPANQMVDFYNGLSTPKRLELAPGDHATVELSGLAGLPNHVWTSLRQWFDQYLGEIGTDIGTGVVLRPHDSSAVESYPDWQRVSARTTRDPLDWSQTIRAGVDTPADAGVVLLSNGLEGLTGVPPLVWLPAVSRHDAAVWLSDRYPAGLRVRGIPRLHLTLTSSRPSGTVVAYLYDVDGAGLGRLVSHAPMTWLSETTGIDVPMQVTAFDLPAGHRLGLVVDTKDPLYLDANERPSTITFFGGSELDLPIR
jgi:predicted acyl esterase